MPEQVLEYKIIVEDVETLFVINLCACVVSLWSIRLQNVAAKGYKTALT